MEFEDDTDRFPPIQEDDVYEEHNEEILENELLKLNMKMLKKQCKKYRVSSQGGKLEMIAKILLKEQENKRVMMSEEDLAQKAFMEEMNAVFGGE